MTLSSNSSDPMSDGFWLDVQDKRVAELEAEVARLREAIHAHRVARRYNPRAAWVDARLWDATGEEV